jgi:hypothetical protein
MHGMAKGSLSPYLPRQFCDNGHLGYASQHVSVRHNGSSFERVEASWLSDEELMTAIKRIRLHRVRRLD